MEEYVEQTHLDIILQIIKVYILSSFFTSHDSHLSITHRVSKITVFPTHKVLSHSREGNASGSSTLLFAFDAILGAVTRSNVKVTSGAFPPAAGARPRRTTVSPERTLLTFADPVAGRMLIIFDVLFICDDKSTDSGLLWISTITERRAVNLQVECVDFGGDVFSDLLRSCGGYCPS